MGAGSHVYSCEWTAWERVYCVDGQERHREQRGVSLPRTEVVRSPATSDYALLAVVEHVVLVPRPRGASEAELVSTHTTDLDGSSGTAT
ncbi:hypothetical protein L2K70_02120 [Nocardioides KLBMP 9356]|uniref:Uncharacterized protein n=1 Tax=Nocardioides potassii TaxID=2911371 RepID=A0ABS9H555_9ACTN|nr:hypothetical protein [Nocardioides potassii]MCF6376390.1 hypothetical protein [Nocardioides potassii]